MIAFCTYRPSPPASHQPPSIRLRCRDFTFLAFHFLTDKDARSVFDSFRAYTCKLGSLEKLMAFSYRSVPREKQYDGWNFYDPKKEFARLGISAKSSEKGWRITDINHDYSVRFGKCTGTNSMLTNLVFTHLPRRSGCTHQHIRQCPQLLENLPLTSANTCPHIPSPRKQLLYNTMCTAFSRSPRQSQCSGREARRGYLDNIQALTANVQIRACDASRWPINVRSLRICGTNTTRCDDCRYRQRKRHGRKRYQ